MKIVILADTIDNQKAGIYVYTKNLINALRRLENKNLKLIFIHKRENIFFKGTEHYIIPRKKIPGYDSFRRFHLIPKLIKKLQPDAVIEPCHIGPFNLPKNIKRVTIIHDLTPILFPKLHVKRNAIIHKLFLKKVLKKANLLIVPSETTKNDILRYSKTKSQIAVIHEGVDNWGKIPANSKEILQKFGIKKPYILFLGTIEPRKNLDILITSFIELKTKNSIPHKLVLAGAIGWKSKKTVENAKKHKDIILTEHINKIEKAALYSKCDFFVYPSLYEGFGLPPLEAMSYGKAVICSEGGALKEIFSNHALTFAATDKEALKKNILSLCQNPQLKKPLSANGLIYSKGFTWLATAQECISAIKRC